MKLTFKELDSRRLKEAIARNEEAVVEVPSRHAGAVDALLEIANDVRSWPRDQPSIGTKWITLQKAFGLSIRALLFHAQLVELLPVLLSEEVEIQRSEGVEGALVLRIQPR
jgi:hypothetical protein